jgi:hypothetical protein
MSISPNTSSSSTDARCNRPIASKAANGGRTIFFFDEGAKKYVYHYFTTAGFHTHGSADFVDGALVTEEKVEGHETIGSVKSRSVFGDGDIRISVVYVGKDGTETPGGERVYRPVADPGRLFPDTE